MSMIIVLFSHLFFERIIVGFNLFLINYIKSYDFHFTVNDGDPLKLLLCFVVEYEQQNVSRNLHCLWHINDIHYGICFVSLMWSV